MMSQMALQPSPRFLSVDTFSSSRAAARGIQRHGGDRRCALRGELEPGNLGWKPPLLTNPDPEIRKCRLNAESANGRLAMVAIIGLFSQDGLTGSVWGGWELCTVSPLRAFEGSLGLMGPPGPEC